MVVNENYRIEKSKKEALLKELGSQEFTFSNQELREELKMLFEEHVVPYCCPFTTMGTETTEKPKKSESVESCIQTDEPSDQHLGPINQSIIDVHTKIDHLQETIQTMLPGLVEQGAKSAVSH